MAGHTACHGMDRKLHFRATLCQGSCQLCHFTLGLGQCHTVTGNNDDLLCGMQHLAHRILRQLFRFFLPFFRGRFLTRDGSAHGGLAGEDGDELAVHGLAHILGQKQSGSTHNTADDHQQRFIDSHTRNAACHTGQSIQKRNGNGHVSAAYPHHEYNAESQRRYSGHDCPCAAMYGLQYDARYKQDHQYSHNGAVIRQGLRLGIQNPGQLTCRDQAAGERQRTHSQCNASGSALKGRGRTVHSSDRSHQCGGRAAQTVQQRNDLRHGDHLCLERTIDAHYSASRQGNTNNQVSGNICCPRTHSENQSDGKDHCDGRKTVTPYRGLDLTHHVDAQKHRCHANAA